MRYFLEIAYDGSPFHGWQVQPDQVTVQGTINEVLSTILRGPIHVVGCGRTDAGVHASQFYLHFDAEKKPMDNLVYKLNAMLPKQIAVKRLISVTDETHARFDAYQRSYTYRVHFEKNPFVDAFSYYCYSVLDLEKMKQVAQSLIHYRDFAAVSKWNEDIPNTICEIYSSDLWIEKDSLRFEITANRFLHNMIRRLMGLLLAVGKNQTSIQEVEDVFCHGGQFKHNFVAPAHGLTLSQIKYPNSIFND